MSGYNSKINKEIQSVHPNPNVLVVRTYNFLADSERKTIEIRVSSDLNMFYD